MESVYKICFYGGLVLAILLVIAAVALFVILKIPRVFDELTGRSEKKGIRSLKAGHGEGRSIDKKEQAKYYNQNSGKIKVREGVSAEKRKENNDDTTDLLRPEVDMDMEVTEVLGAGRYADAKTDPDIDATEVLGGENTGEDDASTEILSAVRNDTSDVRVDRGFENDAATDVLAGGEFDNDAATEVLAADEESDATEILAADDDIDDGATEVLSSTEYEDMATDVLTSSEDEEDEEMTTVLSSGVTDELSGKVKVYYNIVVTHSDERL
ncbi:MAG: hypothetical protein ACI39Q_08470 [Wujia sp.]